MSIGSSIESSEELSPCQLEFVRTPKPKRVAVRLNDHGNCLICGDRVIHRHFGERTCNSCAAFFRRTICRRKMYFCKQSEACKISERRHKHRCAHCRFHRCLIIGMDFKQVNEKLGGFLSESDGSLLATLRLWYRGNFVARRRHNINIFGLPEYRNMWERERDGHSFLRATQVEAAVMQDFLRASGIISPEAVGSLYEKRFCAETLTLWLTIELIYNTRSHGGHRAKKVYYVDDSYSLYNEDSIAHFYRRHPGVNSPFSLARNAMIVIKSILDAAELFHRFAIDDGQEKMAVLLICLLNKAARSAIPHPRAREWTNEIFRCLKSYYEASFNDFAERFGQLILGVETIESAHAQMLQQFSIVRLDYRNPKAYGYDLYAGDIMETYTPLPFKMLQNIKIEYKTEDTNKD
ncbi:Nuclear receptor domain-containing protein [Aphelenchoides besseyi]|nr:Nuclear receptor domain-containing protein [Aphelenchoides besseyi]